MVTALAYKGLVPTWVATVVVGRDMALVAGALVQRWRSLGWRYDVTMQEFLRTRGGDDSSLTAAAGGGNSSETSSVSLPGGGPPSVDPGVPLMQPLMISKVNTVMQLSLAAGCVGKAWVEWPDASSLHMLEVATAGTTAASCLAYAVKFFAERPLKAV